MAETPTPIIVDTSVLFSALVRERSQFSELLSRSEQSFYICEFVFVELFEHKDKLVRATKLTEEELLSHLYTILRRIHLFKENLIQYENRKQAFELCQDIDEKDTPHVALTLELNGLLWTGDKKLRAGLRAKGFNQFFEPRQEG